MMLLTETYLDYLPPPVRGLKWRAHPLDGKLLLFERDGGLNVLLEGDETADLRRVAPRTLLIAVTNICNLACHFCYRDLTSPSDWTYQSLLEFCQQADEWGVLEVAFGGGEPMLFPRWQDFIHELHATTGLCINFTTNGTRLTEDFLRSIDGKYGNIRVSLYDDNHWEQTIGMMARVGARFGVNWLITPDELDGMTDKFAKLMMIGCRDFLFISYKGADTAMHFRGEDYARLQDFANGIHAQFGDALQLKLDSCWGSMLPDVPRLFDQDDCGAGDDFLSITSDKRIKPCSFHHLSIPFETLADVRAYWQQRRSARIPAAQGGCARLPHRGLTREGAPSDDVSHLAAVQQ